jgi:hypothetical protein
MRTRMVLAAAAVLLAAGSLGAKGTSTVASHAARVKSVTLAMRHRVFANFSDMQTVVLQKEFPVGDSDYSAKVIRYVPDFAMELKSGKVISRSNEPKNPAFQIIVREKKAVQDTSWAFMNMPPHFGRKSLLAFKIVRIDFVGAPPIVADTTQAKPAAVAPRPSATLTPAGTKR